MDSITVLSPAKVNLTLEVLERRKDGYHNIRSIMQPVDLFDQIKIEILDGNGIEIESEGLRVPEEKENLVVQAADIFLNETKLDAKVRINLKKVIPIGAGLGGGSSNAAAVLVGLNKITKKLGQEELLTLSPKIGADVAMFIKCQSAIAEGIGEQITVLMDFPIFNYILLNPGFEVSTEKVYERWDKIDKRNITRNNIEERISLFRNGKFPLRNDLEQAAIELYPEIRTLKDRLYGFGAEAVSMTGSGPTVFAVFKDDREGRHVYDYLNASTRFKVFYVKGISGWHRL